MRDGCSYKGNLHAIYQWHPMKETVAYKDAIACVLIERGLSPRMAALTGRITARAVSVCAAIPADFIEVGDRPGGDIRRCHRSDVRTSAPDRQSIIGLGKASVSCSPFRLSQANPDLRVFELGVSHPINASLAMSTILPATPFSPSNSCASLASLRENFRAISGLILSC